MEGLTAEKVMEIYRALEEKRVEMYSFGVIWQAEPTEFCFLDGTQGYGSPYAERGEAVFVKAPDLIYERSRWGR